MIIATGLSKRLKIISNTKEKGKFYLESDRENFEEYKFNKLGERKIIEIISSCDLHPKFNKIYYYSESQDKKIITSNIGADFCGKLLLQTFSSTFLEDVDMFNIHSGKSNFLERRKRSSLVNHMSRVENLKLRDISLGDAMNGMEYVIRSIRSSY